MILVTGASGFVGNALVQALAVRGIPVRACSRRRLVSPPEGIAWVAAPDLGPEADWRDALDGVTCVIHCAARVHVMRETSLDALTAYRRANVAGTLQLAKQAAEAGASRFVFLSSIKVNGEATEPGHPFSISDAPAPLDPYGVSKWEAEQALAELARSVDLEIVVVRPPLVYGPGVGANFLTMMRWLKKGIPLPLGSVRQNQRSLVALGNLVDFLVVCTTHPAAAGQTFLVADGEDVSTSDLLTRMASALGIPARLLPVPAWLLRLAAKLLGKEDTAQRLLGNLQVDTAHACRTLDWLPPLSLTEGLRQTAATLER